ncbi:hypothetical protein ACFL20_06550 [Spirochaetota bacterium]
MKIPHRPDIFEAAGKFISIALLFYVLSILGLVILALVFMLKILGSL